MIVSTKAVASFQNTVVSVAAAGVSVHRSTASAAGRSGGHEGLCSFQALHGSCQHLQCGKETEEPSLLTEESSAIASASSDAACVLECAKFHKMSHTFDTKCRIVS